mgnify:FL=1
MKKFPVEMKNSPFFEGIGETEEEKVLKGLDAHEMTYDKENYILHCGEQVKEMGLLVSGGLLIVQEDFWGNRNLVAKIEPGDVFAETFACMQRRNINVSVIAEEAANVLWLNVRNILDADGETEGWKLVLLRNLLENMAEKNLRFNEKLTHMGKRNTREKLLSYLSAEAQKHGTSEFDIPFSRQQLADYLSVERSAMSTELGKLRDEGRLSFRKNHFCLNRDAYL